jgi:para-nitrobenzyl esterase
MIAETTSGKVEGFVQEDCNVFLGIPYAAPPLGANRFGAPVPHEPWDTVRECFTYGPTAPQRDPGITIIPEPVEPGDDFLNLNVYTPDLSGSLPVFVWIHGGGFVSGCNRSPWYRGTRFARDGVVLVSIGYRLGVEGFLDIDGAPPNRAVLDWIAALEWVRDNIANFGGDPERVTIGGQSAGSAACLTLMVNPRAHGLFRGVIAMSGTSDTRMPRETLTEAGAKLASELGVAPTRDALSRFGPRELVDKWNKVFGNPFTAESVARGFDPRSPALKPYVDGDVIADHPFRAFGTSPLPLLIGSTTQEINGGVRSRRKDLEAVAPSALDALGLAGEKRDAYAAAVGSDDPLELLAQAVTDRGFRIPLARLLEERTEPTWAYQFAWHSPTQPDSSAMHCIDIPFAFDNLDAEGVTDRHRVGEGAPQHLADAMHREWVRFIKGGDVSWPAYDAERSVMVFDERSAVVPDALRAQRELFATR